jgi:IMP dehydrogenase
MFGDTHVDIADGLTFDDVLLRPKYSDIESRSSINVSVKLSKNIEVKHPIVPANMSSIIGIDMARTFFMSGGMSIIHRFMPVQDQIDIPINLAKELGKDVWKFVGLSVGVKNEDRETVDVFVKAGANILCVDIAHGHSKGCIEMCKYINIKYPDVFLIAGNIASYDAALDLWEAGADAVKPSVGGGSLCTTRIETGNGAPTLTGIGHAMLARKHIMLNKLDLYRPNQCDNGEYKHLLATSDKPRFIIADGGVRNAGDFVKSLAMGADLVMCGNIFAGAFETPSETVNMDGVMYKRYNGSSTHKANHIEGVEALIPIKGKTADILQRLLEGIRSGCSYQGAHNLNELRESPEFIRISSAGMIESHPHDVRVIR